MLGLLRGILGARYLFLKHQNRYKAGNEENTCLQQWYLTAVRVGTKAIQPLSSLSPPVKDNNLILMLSR